MKSIILLIILLIFSPSVFAYSSKASKFAEAEYAKTNNREKVYINMKKECRAEYQQKNGQTIVFGYGDIKIKGCKKRRITYVVLYDESCKPSWSKINFYQ